MASSILNVCVICLSFFVEVGGDKEIKQGRTVRGRDRN